jgi:hypothetical protein
MRPAGRGEAYEPSSAPLLSKTSGGAAHAVLDAGSAVVLVEVGQLAVDVGDPHLYARVRASLHRISCILSASSTGRRGQCARQ